MVQTEFALPFDCVVRFRRKPSKIRMSYFSLNFGPELLRVWDAFLLYGDQIQFFYYEWLLKSFPPLPYRELSRQDDHTFVPARKYDSYRKLREIQLRKINGQ